jgi:hypothetical protein
MNYDFKEVPIQVIRGFIETHHYSHNVNGCKVSKCFALYDKDTLVGAILFGALSTTAWRRYALQEKDVVELRRLVCLDGCPRNTLSWFIAKALKILKRTSDHRIVISYADPLYGHVGYIYQAANWSYVGRTAKDKVYFTPDGKMYHSRALRTKYKGKYKPFAKKLQEQYVNGELTEKIVPGKHIYVYNLIGRHKRSNKPYPKGDKTGKDSHL